MRYIDLIVQTLILTFGGFILILMWSDPSWPMGPLLLTQLILGPWQMVSSLVSLMAYANFRKAKRWHLAVALLYLIFLSLCFSTTLFEFDHSVLNLLLTVPAWILALYYYTVTWKWALSPKRPGGNFLPHLSF